MTLYPLPEYRKETPVDRKERFDRFVATIRRELTRGDRAKAFEFYSFVLRNREIGALHDEQAFPLLELIGHLFRGDSDEPKKQGDLFS